MTWSPVFHTIVLLVAGALASWAAVVARGRRAVPISGALGWAMLATAYWALVGALHSIVSSIDVRVTLAQFQYIGIAAVAPLWLLFASQYARAHWLKDGAARRLLWVIPTITVAMAFTNQWHHLLWADIQPVSDLPASPLIYVHGPWFWIAVAFNYLCLLAATLMLVDSIRRFPLPYRQQTALFLLGAALPWVGNVLYLTRRLPPGLDLTPVGFAASGTAMLWGLYRQRLFGLVPIARHLVVEQMDDAVIVLDAQRHIVDFNPSAERLAGCSVDSIGRPVDAEISWWTQSAIDDGTSVSPLVLGSDGGFLEVEVKAVRDGDERFDGWLVLARDISARRKAEAERRELERRMLEQQKVESLSVLAGGVAHDFNNLLTGILGNADLLSMEAGNNTAIRKSASAIIIGAQRAADLVSQMLAYAGEGRIISEIVDLDALVHEMYDLLQASVARHCRLEYHTTGALPPVKVDPTQVRQVVVNLIVNASEAVDDGGTVVIASGTEHLTEGNLALLSFSAETVPGHYAYVDVSDNGPGMDRATLARIFDPFFSTKQNGRGLGLAAVQGIIRSHRGALLVTSTPGRGTTFKVWFPLHVTDVAALHA